MAEKKYGRQLNETKPKKKLILGLFQGKKPLLSLEFNITIMFVRLVYLKS